MTWFVMASGRTPSWRFSSRWPWASSSDAQDRELQLRTVVGTLLAGVLIGQLDIQVPAIVKTVFFDLFLFTTGYKVGPQFFRGLKKDALPRSRSRSSCASPVSSPPSSRRRCSGTTSGPRRAAGRGVLRVHGDRDRRRRHQSAGDPGRREGARFINNIPVAYAVTYLVGTAVLVWFLPTMGPKLMGVNLRDEAKKMQAQGGGVRKRSRGCSRRSGDSRSGPIA